jgi:hypothetical protein
MRRRLELRDLRSLERKSMYSIFHPLDPNERLPRELILEGRRQSWFYERRRLWFTGFAYLPFLLSGVIVMASFGIQPLVAFAIAGVAFVGVFVYVLKESLG